MGRSGQRNSQRTAAAPRRSTLTIDWSRTPRDLLPHPDAPIQGEAGAGAAETLASPRYGVLLRSLHEQGYGLVIDMDDTLNTNTVVYLEGRLALLHVYHELAPERDVIEMGARQKAISNSLIPEYGFTPKRWRVASVTAAEEFAGRPLTDDEREQVLEAAEVAFGIGKLMPGVEQALELLTAAEVPMVLLTKGEQAKQEEKIAGHQLDRFFTNIRIVSHKDAATLQRVVSDYGISRPVVIGDSEASDIKPAQEAGFPGVLIDKGAHAWKVEHVDGGVEAPTVSSFPEAVQLVCEQIEQELACDCGAEQVWYEPWSRYICRSWHEMEGGCTFDDRLAAPAVA
jgi:FMN phosphatase YigB (HAD superfamily)